MLRLFSRTVKGRSGGTAQPSADQRLKEPVDEPVPELKDVKKPVARQIEPAKFKARRHERDESTVSEAVLARLLASVQERGTRSREHRLALDRLMPDLVDEDALAADAGFRADDRALLDERRTFAAAAVRRRAVRALRLCGEERRADRSFVLAAVQRDGYALKFASRELQADEEVVLAAIARSPAAAQFAVHTLWYSRPFVRRALDLHAPFELVQSSLRAHQEIVEAAYRVDLGNLALADPSVWESRRFTLRAVAFSGFALRFAPPHVKADGVIAFVAVSRDAGAIQFLPPELRCRADLVTTAVRKQGEVLVWAPEYLRSCLGIARMAVKLGFPISALPESIHYEFGLGEKAEPDLLGLPAQKRALLRAARSGELEEIDALISTNADLYTRGNEGRTCLHYATVGNASDLVQHLGLLAEQGKGQATSSAVMITEQQRRQWRSRFVNAGDFSGRTALHLASSYDCVKALVSTEANVGAVDLEGRTPLHTIAENNQIPPLQALIEVKANVNSKDHDGHTPLHAAARQGQVESVNFLLRRQAKPFTKTSSGKTPVDAALDEGKVAAAEMIITFALQDVTAKSQNILKDRGVEGLLHRFAATNSQEAVKLILRTVGVDTMVDGRTALHSAAGAGATAAALALLDQSADLRLPEASGRRAMHLAAKADQGLALLLMKMNAAVDQVDAENQTVLHFAAQGGNAELAVKLLAMGADPFAVTRRKVSVLHMAVRSACFDLVSYLIQLKADPFARDSDMMSSFHHAYLSGAPEIVRFLLRVTDGQDDDQVDRAGRGRMHLAVLGGSEALVADALERYGPSELAARDREGRPALHFAAATGAAAAVEIMLEHRAAIDEPDAEGRAALHHAAAGAHVSAVAALVSAKADVNLPDGAGRAPIVAAMFAEALIAAKAEVCIALVDAGAHVDAVSDIGGLLHRAPEALVRVLWDALADVRAQDQDGMSALHAAVSVKDIPRIRALLGCGADTLQVDRQGRTALHLATEVEVVDTLLAPPPGGMGEIGSPVFARDSLGRTPLFLVAAGRSAAAVQALLAARADATARDTDGRSVLHFAAEPEVVEALIRAKADPFVFDKGGRSILHSACAAGDAQWVQALLSLGVATPSDSSQKDNDSITPLVLAAGAGSDETVELLISTQREAEPSPEEPEVPASFVVEPQSNLDAALVAAAGARSASILKRLLAAAAAVTGVAPDGRTALHVATAEDDADAVSFLLQKSSDVSASSPGGTALEVAMRRPGAESKCIEPLVNAIGSRKAGALPEELTAQLLVAALDTGNVRILNFLLREKADVNADISAASSSLVVKSRPLHALARAAAAARAGPGDAALVLAKQLISKKARLTSKDGEGRTPLHLAVGGSFALVREFLFYKADVRSVDKLGRTPLFYADGKAADVLLQGLRDLT